MTKLNKQKIAPGVVTSKGKITTVIVEMNTLPTISQSKIHPSSKLKKLSKKEYQKYVTEQRTKLIQKIHGISKQVKIKESYGTVFAGVAISVPAEQIPNIASLPEVRKIYPNQVYKANLSQSVPLTKADQVWKMTAPSGLAVTGKGIKVGVVDSGVDSKHPDLAKNFAGGYDFVEHDSIPQDENGHGTHVAGIIAANGNIDKTGCCKGVAPDASIYGYRVLDKDGYGSTEAILAGVNKAAEDGMDVLNLSLGNSTNAADEPIATSIDRLVENRNVSVVVANGNDGPENWTVSSPGTSRLAISVGASTKTNQIADFSSRGPATGSWAIKPDVVAPGQSILSTVPQSVSSDGYEVFDGTSMASPHVAGSVALLKQLHPNWNSTEIKSALANTATTLNTPEGKPYAANEQGSGLINVLKAANTKSLALPNNLSFGIHSPKTGVKEVTQKVTLKNLDSQSKTYTIKNSFDQANTKLTATFPSKIVVAPNSSATFDVTLRVDTSDARDVYTGSLTANDGTESLKIPYITMIEPMDYPIISGFGLEQIFFSPNGDTINDDAQYSYYLTAPAEKVTLKAQRLNPDLSEAEEYLIEEKNQLQPQQVVSSWKGTDSKGNAVPNGIYVLRVEAKYMDRSQLAESLLFLDRNKPTVTMPSTFKNNMISGKISDQLLSQEVLDILNFWKVMFGVDIKPIEVSWKLAGTNTWKPVNFNPSSTNGFSYQFRKGELKKGSNQIELKFQDVAGNSLTRKITILVP